MGCAGAAGAAVSLRAAGGCATVPAGLSDSAGFSACRATGSAVVGASSAGALPTGACSTAGADSGTIKGPAGLSFSANCGGAIPSVEDARSTSRNACSVRAGPAATPPANARNVHTSSQPHRRLRGRSGTVSGPMNTGLPEFAGGSWALGQRSLGAMAWILAPLYWFTITSLHLFLRREVDEVFKRTSSARDAESDLLALAEYFGQCIP